MLFQEQPFRGSNIIMLYQNRQQNLHMKQPEKSSKKQIPQLRKHSVSQKTRSDYSNPFNQKEEVFSPFAAKAMKNSMGRKYVQEHLFKQIEKQHHEIVISDEVVKNSKLFRMLKEKIETNDAVFVKEMNELNETKSKLKQEIANAKSDTYNHKLSLWELKNQILELKGILNDEQQESRRLEAEIGNAHNQYYAEQQEQREMEQLNNNQQQQTNQQNLQKLQDQSQCKQQNISYDNISNDDQTELKTSFAKLQLHNYANPQYKSERIYENNFNQ